MKTIAQFLIFIIQGFWAFTTTFSKLFLNEENILKILEYILYIFAPFLWYNASDCTLKGEL